MINNTEQEQDSKDERKKGSADVRILKVRGGGGGWMRIGDEDGHRKKRRSR